MHLYSVFVTMQGSLVTEYSARVVRSLYNVLLISPVKPCGYYMYEYDYGNVRKFYILPTVYVSYGYEEQHLFPYIRH